MLLSREDDTDTTGGIGDGAGDDTQVATGPARHQCLWEGPFVERVNAHLPPDVRVIGATDVGREFHAKHYCDRRCAHVEIHWSFWALVSLGRMALRLCALLV